MRRLLRADMYRMYHNKKIVIAYFAMAAVAGMMIMMQYTAMDYAVPLSRVIFLPMTFYGLVAAAFVSFFVGEDFSEGTVRNKIVAGNRRSHIYLSQLFCVWTASLLLYLLTLLLTVSVSLPMFEKNVTGGEIVSFAVYGCFTVLAIGSIFCLISVCIGNRSVAVTVCMGMAFFMLFLCLHTNQIIAQSPYKDGIVNSHYIEGGKRLFYELVHDINPMGQIAQLSEMKLLNPIRWIGADIVWICLAIIVGCMCFGKKDIR